MAKGQIKLGLIGADGRMGDLISELLEKEFTKTISLRSAIDRRNTADLPRDAVNLDVILDVSSPAATEQFLKTLTKQKRFVPYVIGCTGWTEAQLKTVRAYAKAAPVVLSPNFSPAVNLFLNLIEQAAPLLEKWGYDVVVHETHHPKKKDAPSGTAKAIVERLGTMKSQVHASRVGNIVGTHEVRFVGHGDQITMIHEALDRGIFARGAIMTAEWASRQTKPGMRTMKEVIFE